MFPDTPVFEPELDKFNRFAFSKRIAEVITSRRDPSSIVIGIYGVWGEGKTTVFNFIEKFLEKNSDVVCVRFNPWFFRDEEKLLLSFFKTLADALNRKLTTRSQDIGAWLARCGEIIAPLSLADPTGTVRGSGQIFEKIGNLFSQVELEENKKRIEKILEEENKRLVIFIDDIDRLDKSEIQSIFKLVKLSAGFRNTIYLLAFDEEKVAAAISEKYGSGDLEAGRSFLEKIIQVPLTLPQVSFGSLQKFCFECIDEALKNAELELEDDDVRRFVKYFSEGLAIQLKTPRVAQRYGNTITFSVPLLKGEVNIVDLLLIEGVKIFYPKLYNTIKEKPDYFLGTLLDQGANFEQIKKLVADLIEQSTADLSKEAQVYAKNLLKELFPRLTGILGNIHYGADWQKKWTQEKRIASIRYFKRYFAYTIPEDDISDQSLIAFLNHLDMENIPNISDEIKKITNHDASSIDVFITEIFRKLDELSFSASSNLALALSQMGNYFPRPETLYSFESPFSRAGILVSHLIQKLDTSDRRFELSKEILQTANPVDFAIECFKWIRASKQDNKKEDSEDLFPDSDIRMLAKVVVNRIKDIAQEGAIYNTFHKNVSKLLSFWAYWSSKEETNNYLKKFFEQDPHSAVDFLRCYIPTVWSIGEAPYGVGLPSKGNLDRSTYDTITSVVDAELLIEYLRRIYGEKLDSPEFGRQDDNQSLEELAACQFFYIHNKILADDAG